MEENVRAPSSEQKISEPEKDKEEPCKRGQVLADVQTSPLNSDDQINDRNSNEKSVFYLFYFF